jgi:hypothetical protein
MPIRQGHRAPRRLEPGLPLIVLTLAIVGLLSPNLYKPDHRDGYHDPDDLARVVHGATLSLPEGEFVVVELPIRCKRIGERSALRRLPVSTPAEVVLIDRRWRSTSPQSLGLQPSRLVGVRQ